MASSEADSRLSHVIVPALEKILKNASWRKHAKLAHECKSVTETLTSPKNIQSPNSDDSGEPEVSLPGPLHDGGAIEYSLAESETILSPLINAASSGVLKIADPAVDAIQKLIAVGYLRGEADASGECPESKFLARLIESVCKCHDLGDDAMELLVLKTLLSAVTSISLRIHGDCLLLIVRTCYDIYLGSKNVVNQTTAKASLIQMLVIVFRRMEADSSTVPIQPIVVAELMDPVEKSDVDSSMTVFVQGFITKIMQDIDGVLHPLGTPSKVAAMAHDGAFQTTATVETTNPADLLDSTDKDMLDAKYWEISMYKSALEGRKGELVDGEVVEERDDDLEIQIGNKLRRDAFLVFRALCKLSMKSPSKETSADPQSMRGKIVALELLKILLENAGAVFRTSERFLGAIKQYLCLSLLKNSASTLMIVFQLSCSIFISLVSRFRAGLKAEIGVFFPMIVLRVLENVAQPNFQQKMIVLRFLEKLCLDSQILVDIFINYDCDVNSSNIFERMVNGLLKTAQGVPPGVTTTVLPPQEATLKLEAMKCLVAVLKSMGDWMNRQMRIPDPHSGKKIEAVDNGHEAGDFPMANGNGEDPVEGSDTHSELSNEASDVSNIEQRRAYKLELQEGISLFNRKPKKGIEFLINAHKVGNSPEDIAAFLKDASGLNKTLIGDYLGEREELSLKVMHAYVDSFDFQGMEFDEAIRMFLQGFRLPGEAQKIDRIMEKFAERYCKCNPKVFSSADTAYVLAYSVILLNTDAHNPMVKNKMSPEDFIKNNRGIDDGKDIPEEYLRSLFERISRNEIKMKDVDLEHQQVQAVNPNRLLGLDSILNIVVRKRGEDSHMGTSDDLIRRMQEEFREKARKTESVYYAATDVVILRFMIEVCWAPMLAAFSVPLDQSDDEIVIALCLEGFRYAIHVTSVMSMKTHRDAFVTSLAKFTSLHSPADIKQKNVDAIKAIVAIADEDGNYLQEAWEHILTCVSRFEHLHLLGEGAPPDATFFAFPQNDSEKVKQTKTTILPVLKKKGPGRMQYAATTLMRGSYDSAGIGSNAAGAITSEQVNPLLAPSPLIPFTNNSVPKLSGLCSLNFSASQHIMTQTATDCWTSFAPYLANVVCCPQFNAMLVTLIGQSSKYSGVLALNTTHAKHCLSDVHKVLVSQGATEDLNNICSIHSSNLTEGSCPVAFVDEFESIVDTSRLLTACRKIDPVNECCDQVCQNAINYAARKISLNDMSNSNGNHSLPRKTALVNDCKNIVLRWLAGKLNSSAANSVFRGLSNCNLNKVCPLVFPNISRIAKECGNQIRNQTSCCKATKNYVSYLQGQSFVTNLQALKCAVSLGEKLQKANVTKNIYDLCHISLKDFSLQVGSQESGCLLPSLPSDASFDRTLGIGFICDLNDNVVAPWTSTSYALQSSCNRTTKLPSLPTSTSSQNGLFINILVLPPLFTSTLLLTRLL